MSESMVSLIRTESGGYLNFSLVAYWTVRRDYKVSIREPDTTALDNTASSTRWNIEAVLSNGGSVVVRGGFTSRNEAWNRLDDVIKDLAAKERVLVS